MRHALAVKMMVREVAAVSDNPKVTQKMLDTLTVRYIAVLNISLMMGQIAVLTATESATLTRMWSIALIAMMAAIRMSTQRVTLKT